MGTKVITREYPTYSGSDVYKETKFVGIDERGKPIMEEISLIDCPDCGEALKILQHAATADGLPFVTCRDDCSGDAALTVIDYD